MTFRVGIPTERASTENADAKYFQGQVAYWNEVMRHGVYDDYWKARDLRPHLKNIKPAVLTVDMKFGV